MNIKQILATFVIQIFSLSALAASDHAQAISEYLGKKDIPNIYKEFAQWKAEEPNSPNVEDTWAWYYIDVSYSKDIKIEEQRPTHTEDYMEIIGKEKSEFLYVDVQIYCDSVKKGLDIINQTISKFPDHIDLYSTKAALISAQLERNTHDSALKHGIDLHTGKNDMSEEQRYNYIIQKALTHPKKVGDESVLVDLEGQLIATFSSLLDRSLINKNNWYDLYDKKLEKGEEQLIEVLQTGFTVLYEEAKFDAASQLNNKYLSVYPKHEYFMTNKALIEVAHKDYDSALKSFKALHKKFPKDDIISFSLAQMYQVTGDAKMADKLFNSLSKSSNKNIAERAKRMIDKVSEGK